METDSIIYIYFALFLGYHIHLPWRADMYTNLDDYERKEVNIT